LTQKNDLAVLSFLQHYGCPTPLLDWTYSFVNSLYFATQKVQTANCSWEIDNYFCVYYLEEEFLNKSSMKEIIETGLKQKIDVFKTRFVENIKSKGFSDEQINQTFTDEVIEDLFLRMHGKGAMTFMTKVDVLINCPILYFSDTNGKDKLKYYLNNNMNIVTQKGAFTWNAHPTRPLEHIANDMYNSENPNTSYQFSKCININKTLAGHVKLKLKSLGITTDFIYPDPWKIAKEIFIQTKK
jgi:hypothetical protein